MPRWSFGASPAAKWVTLDEAFPSDPSSIQALNNSEEFWDFSGMTSRGNYPIQAGSIFGRKQKVLELGDSPCDIFY